MSMGLWSLPNRRTVCHYVGTILLTRNVEVDDVLEDRGRLLKVVGAGLREEAVAFYQALSMCFVAELCQTTPA